ncbi:MAG: hypothetical protein LBD06_08375 [Candidatus Accumulibacter sp.]|jgi:hypothetical protein|nr:hypothetical protein [Accumulibacter sp.]
MNPRAGFLPILFLFLFLFLAGPCRADKPEVLPVPPDAAPEIIAGEMRFNGAPMRILQFSTLDADETLAFYRKHFARYAMDGKYVEKTTGRRKMIGAMMRDKRLVNVELTPESRVAARVLVSSLEVFRMRHPKELAKDIPRMPGSQVIQHQDSRDGAKSNRFVTMRNSQSVDGNAMYLREHYIQAGWRRDRDETIHPARHRQLGFSRDNRQLLVDVRKTGQECTVIYNEVTG